MPSKPPLKSLLPESWRVKLPVFEGPLDLLLHLVKANEVEITEIPVVKICDQFQEYLRLMEHMDLDIAGEYIFEAAMLINLKSKLLLPQTVDEEGAAEDPRQELVDRLLEYQKLKEAAQNFAEIYEMRRGVWTRQPGDLARLSRPDDDSVDLEEVSLYDLISAFKTVIVRYDRENPPPFHVNLDSFTIRDQIERLVREIVPRRPMDLIDDLRARSCRAEAVSTFLAILEMLRMSLVRLHKTQKGSLLLYRTAREVSRDELEAIRS